MHKLKSRHIKLEAKNRLYQSEKPIIGLTGSIATGKSTLSEILRSHALQIIDADQLVKSIYKQDESLDFIASLCPQAIVDKRINFQILREKFFNDTELKAKIEKFLYEKLPCEFEKAAAELDYTCADFIIYDVPLLFEKKLTAFLDSTILCYTSADIQLQRLMSRDKISKPLAQKIIQSQIPIEDKKELSQLIVDNNADIPALKIQASKLIRELAG